MFNRDFKRLRDIGMKGVLKLDGREENACNKQILIPKPQPTLRAQQDSPHISSRTAARYRANKQSACSLPPQLLFVRLVRTVWSSSSLSLLAASFVHFLRFNSGCQDSNSGFHMVVDGKNCEYLLCQAVLSERDKLVESNNFV